MPPSHSSRRIIQFCYLQPTLNAWHPEIKIKISAVGAWLAVLTFLVMPQLVRAGDKLPRTDALLYGKPTTRAALAFNQFEYPTHTDS